ncbi:hypothetical protein B5C34_02960 [Pacificimonas flava]|uniref:CHAT domain-containing protein n=2 Tax=Pacificimonas TaxID=1960290 RepID=A0A219B2G9_9SPHN|nr:MULTISPECIES: hypothetical protein [Pacificimonas]MBZ6377819.1 hypothetical protein [Pacificimonas aurantium]OWV32515.1 hypothetical protein B5C34_02960 [Pacificimonas flava]
MIIAVCTDDPMIENVAREASQSNHATFGDWHRVFDDPLPDLGKDEDLFIVAHGAAFGDENQPVIGSEANDFYLTARDLNSNLHIFPEGYSGGVYVSACESAAPGANGLSFVQSYMRIIGPSFPNMTAWGHRQSLGGPLPPPGDSSWTQAS